MREEKNGIIVSSPRDAAAAIVELVRNEPLRVRLGKAAHLSVKNHFLFSRYLLDHLRLYAKAV